MITKYRRKHSILNPGSKTYWTGIVLLALYGASATLSVYLLLKVILWITGPL